MGSGFPHSQGCASPVSQHESNVALTSPQDNIVAPVNGIQHNMIATEYPGEGRVSYSPPQWQQGNTHSKQNVKTLHQLESPASILRTGCQQPTHGDWEGGPRDSCSPINSCLSSKCWTHFGTSANENSPKLSVYNGGPERGCSKETGSNVCFNTEKDGAAAQTSPLLCLMKTYPLLTSILTENTPDLEILRFIRSSQSEKTNGKMKLNTSHPISDGHLKRRQVECSLAAPYFEKTIAQNADHLGIKHSSPSHLPSTEKVSPVGKMMPLTDEQIKEVIERQVVHYRSILAQNNRKCGHTNVSEELDFCSNFMDFTFHFDSTPSSDSAAHLPTTSPSVREDATKQSPNCAVVEECTTVVAARYSSEDSRANTKLFAKSENTGYPKIKRKVAATYPNTEDESPVVLTAMFGMTLDELIENNPCPLANCNSSQDVSKSFGQEVAVSPDWTFNNNNKNLDNMEHMSVQTLDLDYPLTIKRMMESEKRDMWLKPVEAVGLDNVQSVTAISEDLQTKSSSEASKNTEIELLSLVESKEKRMKNIEDHTDFAVVNAYSEENALANIQIHNVVSLVEEQHALSESDKVFSMKTLRIPHYEDISDDENMSQLITKLPNTQNLECRSLTCYESHYETKNEDETLERASLIQESEPNCKLSSFEKDSSRRVQDLPRIKSKIVSDEEMTPEKQASTELETHDIHHCCCDPSFAESDDGVKRFSHPKFDCMRHRTCRTIPSISCSMSSFLKDDNTDYPSDDDWMIFPIIVSDLKREDEDQCSSSSASSVLLDDSETGDKETQRDTGPAHTELQKTAPPLFSLIEEFDTKESFKEAMCVGNVNMLEVAPGFYSPEHEPDSEGELHSPQKEVGYFSEPEDSCDTEDSCDYPCSSEQNYMTVSRKVSGSLVKKVERKLRELMDKNVYKHNQNCENEAKRKSLLPSGTENSGNAHCSQENRLLPETEGSMCGGKKLNKTGLPSTDLTALQHLDMFCDLHNRQKISREEGLIITISSGSEDDLDQNYAKAKTRLVSSSSLEDSDTQCVQQKTFPPTTVDSAHRQASPPQHQPKCQDTHLIYGAYSDKPHSPAESKQLTDSEHSEHKTKGSSFSAKRMLSMESEDSDDTLIPTKKRYSTKTVDSHGPANKMPKTKTSSSKNYPNKVAHSVTKEVDTSFGTNLVIPRLIVQKSQSDTSRLILVKESGVHVLANDVTQAPKIPKEPSKKTEKNPLHDNRRKKGYCLSKPKPEMNRQHWIKNKGQAKVAIPRLDSTQLLLLSQVGPSTSTGNSSTSRQYSEVGQSCASSRSLPQSDKTSTSPCLPKSNQHKYSFRQQSSSSIQQPSVSDSKFSTLDPCHTSTKGPSSFTTTQLPAREEVRKKWKETYFPTRRDRKSSLRIEEESRPTHENSCRDASLGPSPFDKVSRRRHSYHKSETSWMKKSKSDAIQFTKARYLDTPSKQSYSVGENYKWSEKPTVAKATKRSWQIQEEV